MASLDKVTFLHFNDVYNADKSSRFVHHLKETRRQAIEENGRHVCTVFSGDCWSPSIMTTILRGKQMVPVMNAMGIDVACLGNHDLDLGVAEFDELKNQCNFPWLCSNLTLKSTQRPIGNCDEYLVLQKNGGPKLLFLGLIEDGWVETLATVDADDLALEDVCAYIQRRVPELVEELSPDAVIAVSHMRIPNDVRVAEECGGLVDIILGGHDHHHEDIVRNNVRILNSGTDFKEYTKVNVKGRKAEPPVAGGLFAPLETEAFQIVIPKDGPEDQGVVEAIADMKDQVEAGMDIVIGATKVDLDARFAQIRTRETNLTNFVADLMLRTFADAHVALLNAGTLRADRILPAGPLKVRDICDLLPMADPMGVVQVTGEKLVKALENGVCKYPAMEGRFPCLAGVRFEFDPQLPPGARVIPGSVRIKKGDDYSPLVADEKYNVISKMYLLEGKDGYDEAFLGARLVHDDEAFPTLPTIFRNVFTELATLKKWHGMTTQGTVVKAANKFKSSLITGTSSAPVDPFAIAPTLDNRLVNIREERRGGSDAHNDEKKE